MSSVTYDTFLPEVMPYVRDCPEFVAVNAIRNACIEFCEKSTFVRETLPDIDILNNQSTYDLETLVGTGVVMILSATVGYKRLVPKALEELDQMFSGDWHERNGPLQYITQEHYECVRLVMVPDQDYDDPLKIIAATRPLRTSTKVSKVVYERYAEIIGFGARARLHDTPGQPYSDDTAAKKFRMWFESGYGEAKIAATRGRGRSNLVVRPPTIYKGRLDMAAGSYDLLIEQGATFIKNLIWKDSLGVAVDVTGYTAALQVRPHKSSPTVLLTASSDNGYITVGTTDGAFNIEIPAEITAAITASRGVYDLEVTDPEGVVTRLLEGGVEFSKEVTR